MIAVEPFTAISSNHLLSASPLDLGLGAQHMEMTGFEPVTSRLAKAALSPTKLHPPLDVPFVHRAQWAILDSNQRPRPYRKRS